MEATCTHPRRGRGAEEPWSHGTMELEPTQNSKVDDDVDTPRQASVINLLLCCARSSSSRTVKSRIFDGIDTETFPRLLRFRQQDRHNKVSSSELVALTTCSGCHLPYGCNLARCIAHISKKRTLFLRKLIVFLRKCLKEKLSH